MNKNKNFQLSIQLFLLTFFYSKLFFPLILNLYKSKFQKTLTVKLNNLSINVIKTFIYNIIININKTFIVIVLLR